MRINITPKDPKLAKDPAVKKWLREVAKRVEKIMVEQDAPGKMAEAMALGAPLHISSSGKIRVLSSFYIPRPKNLKMHGYRINSKPMTATEVRERQAARDRIIDDFYTIAPKYRTKQALKDMFPIFAPLPAPQLINTKPKKIRSMQYKALRVAIPVKRSKRSYRGDHYQA